MKLFTNATKTRLFSTDNHVKNLHEIEISSVERAIKDWGHSILDIHTLLDYNSLRTGDIDQVSAVSVIPTSIEPDESLYSDDVLTIDFTKDLSYAEIAAQALDAFGYYGKAGLISELKELWKKEDDYRGDHQDLIFTAHDDSKLYIKIDHFEEIMIVTTTAPANI